MCRSCGEFVTAVSDGDTLEPVEDECPECASTEFKNTETGEHIRTD